MNRTERVLVTGSAGCVGSFVIKELLTLGYPVRATDRPGTPLTIGGDGVEVVEADLTKPELVARLVEGIDYVIHAAADIDVDAPYEQLAPTNVDATRYLYEAAARAGAQRFVFMSTGAVYAPSGDELLGEDAPVEATNQYEQTKIDAERYLMSQRGTSMPSVTILRPALIYGPRGRVLMASLATLPPLVRLVSPRGFKLDDGPSTTVVHARDVARAAVLVMTDEGSAGAIYNVSDGESIAVGTLVETAFEVFGMRTTGFRVPFPSGSLLSFVARAETPRYLFGLVNGSARLMWDRLVDRHGLDAVLSPSLHPAMATYGVTDTLLDGGKLTSRGFRYLFPYFRDGWRDTVRWYQENRWVPRLEDME